MSNIDFSSVNNENLKPTWVHHRGHVKSATAADTFPDIGGDPEYLSLWETHFSGFSGKVLEIGAGTGFLAKNILNNSENVEYTILDIERNFQYIKETLAAHTSVNYVKSSDYKQIFDEDWDLLIATHCLSETPRYYYTDILNNLSVKSCFVIDYGGDPNDPGFDEFLRGWFGNFNQGEVFSNQKLLGASKRGGIPVYVGKTE